MGERRPRGAQNQISKYTYMRITTYSTMTNMTLSLPEELHREMRSHPEVKWSEVARRAIQRELERLHTYDRLLSGSVLTDKDAVSLGREVRRAASRRRR